jgi:N-methylhydantoinase B/oxoprolinase/acetone carboxylase alpha subunit
MRSKPYDKYADDDPEILENAFQCGWTGLRVRDGSGGVDQWSGGHGAPAIMTFLEPGRRRTVFAPSSAPFGVDSDPHQALWGTIGLSCRMEHFARFTGQ